MASPAPKFLVDLQQRALSAMQLTFKATYSASGSNSTIVFAQMGTNRSFTAGTTAYYSDGKTSTVCDTSNGTPLCYTGASPLTGLLSLINPMEMATALLTVADAGIVVTHSSERYYGLTSSCIGYSRSGQHVKYCLNDEGVVTFVKIPTGTFDLTGYTTSVTDADVSVPPGATTRPAPPTA